MKNRIATVALLAACPALCVADTCVRIQSHTDEYYYAGELTPATDEATELWFGADRIAYVAGARTYVMDTSESTLVFVNRTDSSYAQTGLPLDWSKLASDETAAFLSIYRRHGEVTETGETRTIGGWTCRAYDVVSWIDVEDGRYDEREERIWASLDPPIDWTLYRETRRDAFRLSNYDDDLIEKLAKIDGLRVLVEARVHIRGFSIGSRERIVEIGDRTPPPGLYSIPDGFREKETLTLEDLRG
jgi:hypothetical protein